MFISSHDFTVFVHFFSSRMCVCDIVLVNLFNRVLQHSTAMQRCCAKYIKIYLNTKYFYTSTTHGLQRLLCFLYVPLSRCLLRCPDVVWQHQHFSPYVNTDRILMKFWEGNHHHQQINWLHFGRNYTRDKGAGMTEISNQRQTGAAT